MTAIATCPKCGSGDFRSLHLIHEAGLSTVNTQTRGSGCSPVSLILFPLIGFWSLLFSSFGRARTSGTVQSVASLRAAPPARKPVAFSVLLVLAGVFLLRDHLALGVLALVIGGLSLYVAFMYNSRVYPYQRQVWEQSAACQRCGTVFVPDASGITLDAVTTKELLGQQGRTLSAAARPLMNQAQSLGGQAVRTAARKTADLRAAADREVAAKAQRTGAEEQQE